jgi:hypothetical protein
MPPSKNKIEKVPKYGRQNQDTTDRSANQSLKPHTQKLGRSKKAGNSGKSSSQDRNKDGKARDQPVVSGLPNSEIPSPETLQREKALRRVKMDYQIAKVQTKVAVEKQKVLALGYFGDAVKEMKSVGSLVQNKENQSMPSNKSATNDPQRFDEAVDCARAETASDTETNTED